MFDYQIDIYEKQNNVWGWHELTGWTRPFTDGTRLDETLDSGSLNLVAVERSQPIKPFTRLRIIVSENDIEKERIYRIVSSTKRTRKRYTSPVLYDWTINTIELTKLLERRLIDTMTVTNWLGTQHVYDEGVLTEPVVTGSTNPNYIHINETIVPQYHLLVMKGTTVEIPKSGGFYQSGAAPSWVSIVGAVGTNYKAAIVGNQILKADGTAVATSIWSSDNSSADNSITYTFEEDGTYTITTYWEVYRTSIQISTNRPEVTGNYTWTFSVYSQEDIDRQANTITTVCERLLSAGITRRKGIETQEFLLDPNFAEEYANVLSPEFSFTNSTLFEALLQVGGFIHAIPRLIPRSTSDDTHYYVTFDKLGGDVLAPELPPMIYGEQTIDVNDWVGQIDTPAQNLVNTEDVVNGSITELGDSFITVRTEQGQVQINGDNILIRTSKPIQQIIKVECGYVGTTYVGDITPYVYESAEYQALSSYWGTVFPYSKAWAIYYTQGGNTIDGLTFRLTDTTSTTSSFSNYAIVNIIERKTGTNVSGSTGEFMRKLAFRVTYVPIAQARVKAHKPSLAEGGAVNNALTYNQGANVVETSFYGEKMRGAIARLGHDVETRTYDIFNYYQLPKVGQLLTVEDEYGNDVQKYIAHIDYEWDITKVRITLALTKDFNMLSQFVGLNSNYRLYDISEKQSVERNVNYDELVVVGDAPSVDMGQYLMNKNVAEMMRKTFGGYKGRLEVARLTPYDDNSQEIENKAVILPVVAFPFGTSIALNFSYYDNYGAGYQQSDAYETSANYAVQRLVPYTDQFGEIKYLKVTFDSETGWNQSGATAYNDNSPAMLYPQLTTADSGSNYIATGNNYIDLQKDSREFINFTYQLHFVSTRPSIVLGSGLAKHNPYVNKQNGHLGKVVWLTKPINGLNKYIDYSVSGGYITELQEMSGNTYVFDPNKAAFNRPQGEQYKAYAVVIDGGSSDGAYRVNAGITVFAETSMTTSLGVTTSEITAESVDGNANVCMAENVQTSRSWHQVDEYGDGSLSAITIQLSYTPLVSTIVAYYIPTSISGDGDDWLPVASNKWSYDATTNIATIDQNGRNFKVEYNTEPIISTQDVVYIPISQATAITVAEGNELLFGENIDNTTETLPTITFAGALMQACNQDRPNCLKFIKNGTTRYTQAYTSGLIPVPIPLTLDVDGTYSGNDISLGTTVYVVDRFIKGGGGQYHAFVQIPGESGYYVKYEDIVTAYDFE